MNSFPSFVVTFCSTAVVFGFVGYFWGRFRARKEIAQDFIEVSEISGNLTGSAHQVASVSAEITQSTQEQFDVLSGTVSASTEIRSMIDRTTASTGNLQAEASNLSSLTKSGTQVISQMVSSSEIINTSIENFNHEMQISMAQMTEALETIKKISTKTQVINDIVFQTKLLSFNASVEAARAGEAGKGFSIVADEVGKLARKSGESSNEIAAIVEQSVQTVQTAISSTQSKISSLTKEMTEKSELGLKDAKHCKEIFDQMEGKINQTTEMISHISTAAEEQSKGVSQLDESLIAFQEVANRNGLVASQATEHSKEFESQAYQLSKTVKKIAQQVIDKKYQNRLHHFEWSNRLELGVESMDAEHKTLLGKINSLITALDSPASDKKMDGVLQAFTNLAGYTVQHFKDEEEFMESVDYPQIESHKKIHQKLLTQVGGFAEKLKDGSLDKENLISFLRNWLFSHIMGVDRQYAEHEKVYHQHDSSRAHNGVRFTKKAS